MAEKGSFWSSLPGVLTGIAGLATAVVALLSLAASQGWIGGGGGDAGSAGGGAATARLEVEPASLQFRAVPGAPKEQTVKVTNDGDAPAQLQRPEITGADAGQFEADAGDCSDPLAAGLSCTVTVTFVGGLGDEATATLVVTPENGRPAQVSLEAGLF